MPEDKYRFSNFSPPASQLIEWFLSIDSIAFVTVTIISSFLRVVIPYANYIFFPLLFFFFLFSLGHALIRRRESIIFNKARYLMPVILLALFEIMGFLRSNEHSLFATKEPFYLLIVLFLSIGLILFVDTIERFEYFKRTFFKQFIVISCFVGGIGLAKFLLQIAGFDFAFFGVPGTSLVADYNFYALFIFIGLIALINQRPSFRKFPFALLIGLLAMNILLSGSRRGLFLLLVLFVGIFLLGFDFKFALRIIVRRVYLLILTVALCSLVTLYFLYYPPLISKKKSIDLHSNVINRVHQVSASILYRYSTIANIKSSYEKLFEDLWIKKKLIRSRLQYKRYEKEKTKNNLIYNGKFETGLQFWQPLGIQTELSLIDSPFGKAVLVKRYDGDDKNWALFYSGRDIIFYSGHKYRFDFKYKVLKGGKIPFKVGFGVGDSYYERELDIENEDITDGWKQGTSYYTFIRSQADVSLFVNSLEDSSSVAFADISLTDVSGGHTKLLFSDQISNHQEKVKDYIDSCNLNFFKHPESTNLYYNGDFISGSYNWIYESDSTSHKLIKTPFGPGLEVSRSDGNGGNWAVLYVGRPIIYHPGHRYEIKFLAKVIKGNELPFNVGWWVNDNGQGFDKTVALSKNVKNLMNGWKEIVCTYRFKELHTDLPSFLNSLQDHSVVHITKVELTDLDRDTSLPLYVDQFTKWEKLNSAEYRSGTLSGKGSTSISSINRNKLYSVRSSRLSYSMVIFNDSLNIPQKLFGGGFDYMKMFGSKFGDADYDYPHNPFLSALLFSGIVGGLYYIWFILFVFCLYIKHYGYLRLFFISFLITFFFSFFSVNTHFTIPLFAILSIIPFVIRYILAEDAFSKRPEKSK